MGITTKLRGRSKLRALQAHRLLLYLDAFDRYCQGKADWGYLADRRQKLIDSGFKPKLGKGG